MVYEYKCLPTPFNFIVRGKSSVFLIDVEDLLKKLKMEACLDIFGHRTGGTETENIETVPQSARKVAKTRNRYVSRVCYRSDKHDIIKYDMGDKFLTENSIGHDYGV